MEQQLDERELIAGIIEGWINMSVDRPELTSHIWLRALSIMSGLTLNLSGAGEEQAEGAMKVMSELAMEVYRNTPKSGLKATLQ